MLDTSVWKTNLENEGKMNTNILCVSAKVNRIYKQELIHTWGRAWIFLECFVFSLILLTIIWVSTPVKCLKLFTYSYFFSVAPVTHGAPADTISFSVHTSARTSCVCCARMFVLIQALVTPASFDVFLSNCTTTGSTPAANTLRSSDDKHTLNTSARLHEKLWYWKREVQETAHRLQKADDTVVVPASEFRFVRSKNRFCLLNHRWLLWSHWNKINKTSIKSKNALVANRTLLHRVSTQACLGQFESDQA